MFQASVTALRGEEQFREAPTELTFSPTEPSMTLASVEITTDVLETSTTAKLRPIAELAAPVNRVTDLLGGEFPEWQERALCAQTDPEAFFPEKGGSTREAKKICLTCDVKSECLQYALANDERFGIWGGLSERERRKLRKRVA